MIQPEFDFDDPIDLDQLTEQPPEVDDPFGEAMDPLQYKDEVTLRLLECVDEYLSFATTRDLIKLLGNNL